MAWDLAQVPKPWAILTSVFPFLTRSWANSLRVGSGFINRSLGLDVLSSLELISCDSIATWSVSFSDRLGDFFIGIFLSYISFGLSKQAELAPIEAVLSFDFSLWLIERHQWFSSTHPCVGALPNWIIQSWLSRIGKRRITLPPKINWRKQRHSVVKLYLVFFIYKKYYYINIKYGLYVADQLSKNNFTKQI